MAEISWIKLSVNIFDDEKIKLIDTMPENDAIFRIWVFLLSMAGKTNDSGLIYLSDDIPYTDEMIATLCDRPISIVRLALNTFKKFGMIEIYQNGILNITNWGQHQNLDGMDKIREQARLRKQSQRKREKSKELLESHVTSRDSHATERERDKERELEKEKEKEIEREENIDEKFARYFQIFINFTKKNLNKRAMALQEFIKLPPFQKDEAIIGAENYTTWYEKDSPDDVSHQYSVNAYEFLRNAMFTEYQEVPIVSKTKPKRTGGMR